MNIVIEGADATGKSTLAHFLAHRLGLRVIESEGPPRFHGDIIQRIHMRMKMTNTIFVRHPVVSHPIYEAARRYSKSGAIFELVPEDVRRYFYMSKPVFIYCARALPDAHIAKDHDTPEHLEIVKDHGQLIEAMYRQWAGDHANIIYRIGDDHERILSYLHNFDPVRDVQDFHLKNGIQYEGKPRALDFETAQFRIKFIREELKEYEDHADATIFELDKLTRSPTFQVGELAYDNANFIYHLAQSLDALVDLAYVTLGTAHLQGFDFRTAWQRVHHANMQKVAAGEARNAEERRKLKMTKPPGWEAPRHEDLVEDHAHRSYRP